MEKLGMSKLKEILRLRHECNLSARQISRALNISHTVVNNYLSKATVCDKNYDELKELSYNEIISNLFPSLVHILLIVYCISYSFINAYFNLGCLQSTLRPFLKYPSLL